MDNNVSHIPLMDGKLPYQFRQNFADLDNLISKKIPTYIPPQIAYNAGLNHFEQEEDKVITFLNKKKQIK